MSALLTPHQTVGPFFHHCLVWPDGPFVVEDDTPGAIRLHGRIVDGAGDPVADALVETWQADPDGRFNHPQDPRGAETDFRGFGRCPTDDDGAWFVTTLKPGAVPGPDGTMQAPHVAVSVFARGLLHRLATRLYFADEAEANEADPVLSGVEPARRSTLIAARDDRGYRLDIHLQGDRSTVFFAV